MNARILILRSFVSLVSMLALFTTALEAGATSTTRSTRVPLQHCRYGDDIAETINATAVYPKLPVILESADGTTFITPPPYPEFPPTVVGIGLLPSGLYDWLTHEFTVLSPAHHAQLANILDVYGNNAFESGPFVAHLFVRFRVESTLNELQCAVIYWDGGDPSTVEPYIQDGHYIGPSPLRALDGTWVGNGIGGPAPVQAKRNQTSDGQNASVLAGTSEVSATSAADKPKVGFAAKGCGSSSLPSSSPLSLWIFLFATLITLWVQKYRRSEPAKTTAN